MAMSREETVQTKTVQDPGAGRSQQRENHVKSEMSNRAPLNSTFREGSRENRRHKNTQLLSPHKRHWTDVDFVGRSTRHDALRLLDTMRHIIGISEPDATTWSDKEQNRRCRKKDKDQMEFLCELDEAQVARGRYLVHELTPEINSRMLCVAKIMAMSGT